MAIWEDEQELKRLKDLEEIYAGRYFGAQYAFLSDEHHKEAEGYKEKLEEIRKKIRVLGGKHGD